MSKSDDRIISALHTAAAEFINRESNRRSLVTVTKVVLTDEKHAQIFVSVYPQKDGAAVTDFLSRQREEFFMFMRKTVKLHSTPHVVFLLDPEMGQAPQG
jgi:ribosome-binding factor A